MHNTKVMFLCYFLFAFELFSNILDNILFIIHVYYHVILHSLTISLNSWFAKTHGIGKMQMIARECRMHSKQYAPMHITQCTTRMLYSKVEDEGGGGGAKSTCMTHTRKGERMGARCWLRENANVFGTMSKGAYNVEGGVAGDRRTIRRATILRVYLGTSSRGR